MEERYDVIIIGAGVVGTMTARALARYDLRVLVVEKGADVCAGTSKANSAIIHAGYDSPAGTLKGDLCRAGNAAYAEICDELHVPFQRVGSFVAAFTAEEEETLDALHRQGEANGVPGVGILSGAEARRLEPGLAPDVRGVLHAPSAGILNPFLLVFALAADARRGGVEFRLSTPVTGLLKSGGQIEGILTSQGEIRGDFVINAAGLYSDEVSAWAGHEGIEFDVVKGEYLVGDRGMGALTSRIVFPAPSKLSKGILVAPTTDGNTLFGPTATRVSSKEDSATTPEGGAEIREKAVRLFPGIDFRRMIAAYAGLRAKERRGDFIIGVPEGVKGFLNAAGIQSPGFTAAPAIAGRLVYLLKGEGLSLREGRKFSPAAPPFRLAEGTLAERERGVAADPRYGHVVCRCETISEGEVVDAVREGATTLDGVKFRRRAGAGRCQGGFCGPRVAEILSREMAVPLERVTKHGPGSEILAGRLRKGWQD